MTKKEETKIIIKMKPKSLGIIFNFLHDKLDKLDLPSAHYVDGEAPFLTIKGEVEEVLRELEQEIIKGKKHE